MKKRPWLKWIGIILCLVMIVFIINAFVRVKKANEAERAELRKIAKEYEDVIRPLLREKMRLEIEINEQEKLVADEKTPPPVILLCTEPNERILSDVYPIINQYIYSAAIVISEDAFPGEAGWMSISELTDLCDQGWELCLGADADTDLAALCQRVTDAGLPLPVAVYYPSDNAMPQQKEQMLDLGIQTVIFYEKKQAESGAEGFWYLSAYGSNEMDSKTEFQTKVRNATPQALTVGYSNSREKFAQGNYESMIKTINSYEKKKEITVMSIQNASRAFLENQDKTISEQDADAEQHLSELREELNAVNEKLRSIMKKGS